MANRGSVAMPLPAQRAVAVLILLTAGFVAGCDSTSSPPADTGAREVLQGYCEALLRRVDDLELNLRDLEPRLIGVEQRLQEDPGALLHLAATGR